jgi:LPS sulfotransferase NodH
VPNPLLAALDLAQAADKRPLTISFDWSVHGISRLYIIVMSGRSGSTWLQHLIEDTKLAGAPAEYFNETSIRYYLEASGASGAGDYLSALARTYSSNKTFGFKINPDRFVWLQDLLDVDAIFTDQGCKWFFMTRMDFVSQAYSFLVAKRSGKWHTYATDADGAAVQPLPDDDEWFDREMWKIINDIIRQEQYIWQYFHEKSIAPVCYSYEDMLADKRVPLLLTLRHVGVATEFALLRIGGLVDRVVRNPTNGDERLMSFVARFTEAILAIHRDRYGIDLAGLMRNVR